VVRRSRALVAAVWLLGFGVPIAEGVEPSGHVVWNVSRVASSTPGAAPCIRLSLQSVTALAGVELRVEAPERVSIAVRSDRPPALDGEAFLLGDLAPGGQVVLDFDVTLPPGSGGIVGFVLTGTLPDGQPVREAVGWTLAAPRGRPTPRFGAAEYPAVVVPEEVP
jgi:hypothetical protein